ncbi:MAG: PDZ domain-containing protein [Anaerolineales bacterium]|nr:PDZ domain-containing protein [Anaerolineales bacterium]
MTWLITLGRALIIGVMLLAAGAGLFLSGLGLGLSLFTAPRAPAQPLPAAAAPAPAPASQWLDEPILRLQFEALTPEAARQAGWPLEAGALVRTVEAGGLGARAGLQTGDIIQGVNGLAVDARHGLDAMIIAQHRQGTLTLDVWRAGQTLTLHVDLRVTRDEVEA